MNRKKDILLNQCLYAAIHAMLWGGHAVIIGFCSNFLKLAGFQDSHVSIVLGIASGLSIIAQIGLTELVGKIKKLDLALVMEGQALMMAAAGVLMTQYASSPVMAAFGIGLGCTALQTFLPFANSIATAANQGGAQIHFPTARGMGSIAYSTVSLATGYLIGVAGAGVTAVLTIIIGIGLFLVSFGFRAALGDRIRCTDDSDGISTEDENKQEKSRKQNGSIMSFCREHFFFAIFLAGSIFMYVNHSLICSFMQQIISAKGGGAGEQGTAVAIAGIMELPVMFGFGYLLKKAKGDIWVIVSGVFFLMKAVLTLIAPDYHWIYATQVFQMGGFALYTVASVEYVSNVFKGENAVRAQSYLASTITMGSLIASATGGVICQYLGVEIMLVTASVLAAVGCLLVCRSIRMNNKNFSQA